MEGPGTRQGGTREMNILGASFGTQSNSFGHPSEPDGSTLESFGSVGAPVITMVSAVPSVFVLHWGERERENNSKVEEEVED